MRTKSRISLIPTLGVTISFAIAAFSFLATSCSALYPAPRSYDEIQDVVEYIYDKATVVRATNPFYVKGRITKIVGDMAFMQKTNSKTNKVDAIRIKGIEENADNLKEGDVVQIEGGLLELDFKTPTMVITEKEQITVIGKEENEPIIYEGIQDYLDNGLETSTANGIEEYAYSRYVQINGVLVSNFSNSTVTMGEEKYYYGLFKEVKNYYLNTPVYGFVIPEGEEDEIFDKLQTAVDDDKLVNLRTVVYQHGDRIGFLLTSKDEAIISDIPNYDYDVIERRQASHFVYSYNSNSQTFNEDPLRTYYMKNQADIPYVEIGEFMEDRDNVIYGRTFNTTRSEVEGHSNQTKYQIGSKGYFIVDSENDTLYGHDDSGYLFNPYTKSASGARLNYSGDNKYAFVDNDLTTVYTAPKMEVTFDLGQFNIDIIKDKYGNMYAPLNTMGNILFTSIGNYGFAFNGKDYYKTSNLGSDAMYSRYVNESPYATSTSRSQKLAEFTYNDLCFSIRYVYGLYETRQVTDPDALISGLGLKDMIKSTNNDLYSEGITKFAARWLFEGHAGLLYNGPCQLENQTNLTDLYYDERAQYNPRQNLFTIRSQLLEQREAAGKSVGLEIYNNKLAIIRFDAFNKYTGDYSTLNVDDYTYAQLHDLGSELLFKKAFKEIETIDTIEDVIIDNSINGGGAVAAVPWLTAYMNPHPSLACYYRLYDQVDEVFYNIDINTDGVIDEHDTYQGKYNFYILDSEFSFSCGNLLPTILKTKNSATLIGKHAGGGICIVSAFATASGTVLRNSCNKVSASYDQNAHQFVAYEDGVPCDYELDYSIYYNPEALYTAIHSF